MSFQDDEPADEAMSDDFQCQQGKKPWKWALFC
jgi:hypothetical protein